MLYEQYARVSSTKYPMNAMSGSVNGKEIYLCFLSRGLYLRNHLSAKVQFVVQRLLQAMTIHVCAVACTNGMPRLKYINYNRQTLFSNLYSTAIDQKSTIYGKD